MRGKYILNIDRLEVCYTASRELALQLIDTAYYEGEGFRLIAIESMNDTKETDLAIDIQQPTEDGVLEWVRYGMMRLGSRFEDEDSEQRYVWIRLDNRMLYTPIYPYTASISYLYFIADSLGLHLNNITKLDIAADSTTNFYVRVKRAVRNMDYTPVILGRAYEEPSEIIDRLMYIHTGDRTRYRTNTITIASKEKDMTLCIYNKTEEIQESGKDYIAEWDGISGVIHRAEMRLKRTSIKDYLQREGITWEDLYQRIQSKEMLFEMFLYFADKTIRFRDGRNKLSILEI